MKTVVATAIAAFALFAAPAMAETVYDANGTATGTDNSTVHKLSADHLVIVSAATYSAFAPENDDNPMKNLSGDCFGLLEIRGLVPLGSGYCIWNDSEDGSVTIRWQVTALGPEGVSLGNWNFLSGTGKWEGVTGGGSYSVTTGDDNARTNKVTGAFRMKE